jgi:hypothetical protein
MDQLTITFITATSALVSGIAGPLVSMRVARRQIKATVISSNRERWTEALRDAIAEYISVVASVAVVELGSSGSIGEMVRADEEFRRAAERMILARSKILLMTNPNASYHNELCRCLETVHALLISHQPMTLAQWHPQLEAITVAGRAVLQAEWERVKRGD